MPITILVMGLSGSGKSFLSKRLQDRLNQHGKCEWLNADLVRESFNDWDFSVEGRLRQGKRMQSLAQKSTADFVILDFIAPLEQTRKEINPDWVIWLDTVEGSKYKDTDFVFEPPKLYDFHINNRTHKDLVQDISCSILENKRKPTFSTRLPTVQMLGRFQPWHKGHEALFCRALKKTGQVAIMVRDCYDAAKNPFSFDAVEENIRKALDQSYQGSYEIFKVPNIVNITYGRDVGYSIEREFFDADIESISATNIRERLRLKGNLNV